MINTASEDDALRSGLYAIRSIKIPSTVHTITAATIARIGDIPAFIIVISAIYAPIIITSPWAKFSIFAIP